MTRNLASHSNFKITDSMTPRMAQAVTILCTTGKCNKLIARDMGITDHAVKFHIAKALEQTNTQSREQLILEYHGIDWRQ